MVDAAAGAVPVSWSLITTPDEREFCCVVTRGTRCDKRSAFLITGASGALDDYTFTCAGHLELVRQWGDVVTPLDESTGTGAGLGTDVDGRTDAAKPPR
jgi:hypothetical protein